MSNANANAKDFCHKMENPRIANNERSTNYIFFHTVDGPHFSVDVSSKLQGIDTPFRGNPRYCNKGSLPPDPR